MATYRTSAAGGGTSGTVDRTCTIVPAVGDLFVVFCNASGNTNASPTCSDDNGGSYTLITTALKNTSADILSVFVRTATLANTTSTIVTVATGSNTAAEIVVVALAGMTQVGAAAVLQSKTQANQAASTTPAPAFTSSALTSNVTLGAVANTTTPATMTAPTNWTERQDVGQSTPSTGLEVVSRDSGFTGTTVTWGSTSASAFASVILEMDGSNVTNTDRTPTVGSFTAAGVAAAFILGTILTPLTGALAATGQPGIIGPAVYTQAGTLFFGVETVTNTDRTPATGALTITGLAPTMGLGLTTTAGSLAATGQAGRNDRALGPSAGTLTLAGQQAGLPVVMTPSVATLTLTGLTPVVTGTTPLMPASGSLFVGLGTSVDTSLPGTVGSLALTGFAPSLRQFNTLAPLTGTLALTGTNPPLSQGLPPPTGSLTLTGGTPAFQAPRPGTGTLTLTEGTPFQPTVSFMPFTGALYFGESNALGTGALALTGYAPNLGAVVTPGSGTALLGLSSDVLTTPATGALTWSGFQARPNPPDDTSITPATGTLRLFRVPNPDVGTMSLTGAAPLLDIATQPRGASILVLSGQQAAAIQSISIRPTGTALTLTGQLSRSDVAMMPTFAGLALTGYQPTLQESGGTPASNTNVLPGTADLSLAGQNAVSGVGLLATTGALALTSGSATLDTLLSPLTGSVALAGTAPSLSLGAIVVPTGTLTLSGLAPDFLGRLAPLTGALSVVGESLASTVPSLTIATGIASEGCNAGLTGTATEGCATTATSVAIEGATSPTTTVCDYV